MLLFFISGKKVVLIGRIQKALGSTSIRRDELVTYVPDRKTALYLSDSKASCLQSGESAGLQDALGVPRSIEWSDK